MPRIVCEVRLEPPALERLDQLCPGEVATVAPHDAGWELPPDLARTVEILLCKRPPDNLNDLAALRLIQISTVGYEHLRERGFADRPVQVCNARGIFDTAIAEWCVAMMIALARDLRGMLRNQDHAVWMRSDRYQQEVRGSTVGLWGYGGIGRATARLAKALGMTVHVLARHGVGRRDGYYTPPDAGDPDGRLPDRVFSPAERTEFLGGLDFLVLALPHTRDSDGLIGEAELRALPRHAFLLNPARGPIVQEAALLQALRQGTIAGAALDTHFAYPLPADHPLWRFPNVILTPHVSGADRSRQFPARIGELIVANVERYLIGQPLLNELTRREWLEA
ncbi:MAG: D-2-hydroxyacid dehydrogenase [Gemmataceae bacterium]